MQIASDWIQDCITNHDRCESRRRNLKSPTRLLELCQPSPDHVRLIETSNLSCKPTYMTLSHCWGSAIFLKLTAGTFSQFTIGIPLTSLPKTFQDAANVAWQLGSKYLWIDSLCIRQDSLSDWQQEAATMNDVYAGSLCNIVASASSDSNGGCFRKRDPRFSRPSIVNVRYANRQVFQVSIGLPDLLAVPYYRDNAVDKGLSTVLDPPNFYNQPSDAIDKIFPLFVRGCKFAVVLSHLTSALSLIWRSPLCIWVWQRLRDI